MVSTRTVFVASTFVLVCVAFAGVIGVGSTAQALGQEVDTADQHTASISVTGAGEASAEPDLAIVFVAATARGDTSSVAADRLATNVSQLREAMTTSNLTTEFRTTDYQLYEREVNDTRTFVARQSFEVTVADTDAVGDVIDLAVANGATEVNGVSFTLSNERRREVRATAIDRAVTDARAEADAVAESTDLTVGPVRSVSVDDGGFFPVRETGDGGTEIDPGAVTVSASVRITYNATGG